MSAQHLNRLMRDREKGLELKRERRGIDTGDDIQGVRCIEQFCMMLKGLMAEMDVNGHDNTSRIGVLLVQIRAAVDTLEVRNERVLVNSDGEEIRYVGR